MARHPVEEHQQQLEGHARMVWRPLLQHRRQPRCDYATRVASWHYPVKQYVNAHIQHNSSVLIFTDDTQPDPSDNSPRPWTPRAVAQCTAAGGTVTNTRWNESLGTPVRNPINHQWCAPCCQWVSNCFFGPVLLHLGPLCTASFSPVCCANSHTKTTLRGGIELAQVPDFSNVTWTPAYDSCGYEHYMPDPTPVVLPDGFKAGRNRAKPSCCGPQYNMKPELPIRCVDHRSA